MNVKVEAGCGVQDALEVDSGWECPLRQDGLIEKKRAKVCENEQSLEFFCGPFQNKGIRSRSWYVKLHFKLPENAVCVITCESKIY